MLIQPSNPNRHLEVWAIYQLCYQKRFPLLHMVKCHQLNQSRIHLHLTVSTWAQRMRSRMKSGRNLICQNSK